MLLDLHVRNLAVIDEVAVQFGPGLNILTGETGAGKSIVVDSLALLAGVRATSDLIRSGKDRLSVSGRFEPGGDEWRQPLLEAGLEPGDREVVVRREVSREGRNRVYLDDQPVTLRLLSAVAPHLLRIHTQREELSVLAPEQQRSWLDRSGGSDARRLLAVTRRAFSEYRVLADRLARVLGNERLRNERIDLLRFQTGEIDAARLVPEEEGTLREDRTRLQHAEAIRGGLGAAFAALFDDEGSAVERLAMAERRLAEIVDWEPGAESWVRQVNELRVSIEELATNLRERLGVAQSDPDRLNEIEARLALVDRLVRKYGGGSASILDMSAKMHEELEQLEADAENRETLEDELKASLEAFRGASGELSTARREWGAALSERLRGELADLALGKARFAVELGARRKESSPLMLEGMAVDFGEFGHDDVRFQFAPNPGEPLAPMARIVSGGELSRVYLALQLAVRDGGDAAMPALVFDEVDAGIGGAEGAALGRKLSRLGKSGQVLAVTHLPQVASFADRHFKVSKSVRRGRTRMSVTGLDSDGRVDEVARMLAGEDVTRLSRSHAEELITAAAKAPQDAS